MYTVLEALELIRPGSLIIAKEPQIAAREIRGNSGNIYTQRAAFPRSGMIVRDIRIKKSGSSISYELLFEGRNNSYYITHSNIDFDNSVLTNSPIKRIEDKIKRIEQSIENHLEEIEFRKEKIIKARDEITTLKSKIRLMEELGEELDEETLNTYLMVRKLKQNDGSLTDLDIAKELIKFKKK